MNNKLNAIGLLVVILLIPALLGFTLSNQEDDSSYIKFKIKNAGITVEGLFESFVADIHYDKNNPGKSKFNGIIKVSSINTGIKMRDNDLQKEEYFDAVKYPVIKFISTDVEGVSSSKLRVSGNLTIKNTTKKIVLEVVIAESGGKTIYSSSLKLNRRDYGVGGKSWMLADEVDIDLKIIK
ncbi:MAG: YceI family protein [Bacteroidetes bacterium]|nr:YceI family protein [Bacteroidota bacterium]HET6244113.1 YceI family protein [Bacteroidia bacterium]